MMASFAFASAPTHKALADRAAAAKRQCRASIAAADAPALMAVAPPAAGDAGQAVVSEACMRQPDRLLRAQRHQRNRDPQSVKR